MASDENNSLYSTDELNKIRSRFESFDTDDDGGLTSTELKQCKIIYSHCAIHSLIDINFQKKKI